MSAPETNLKKQKRQHGFVLFGIGAALVFGLAMLFFSSMGYVDTDEETIIRESAEEIVADDRSVAGTDDETTLNE